MRRSQEDKGECVYETGVSVFVYETEEDKKCSYQQEGEQNREFCHKLSPKAGPRLKIWPIHTLIIYTFHSHKKEKIGTG